MITRIAVLCTDNREQSKAYDCPEPNFGTAPEALLQGFAQLPQVEIHVVSCTQQPMRSPAKLAENTWFHSLHVPKFGWMRTAYAGCIRTVRKKLQQIQPDIVHGQGTERDCAISAVFSGFPNIITIHGNMRLLAQLAGAKPFSFHWLAARLESFTVPRSAGILCITRYTQEAVSSLAKRTWVVPNAADASFFMINAQPLPEAPPRILCVGHVCPRKNQNAFIRALDPLARTRKFEVVFLGQAQQGRAYDDEFFSLVHARPWCRHGGFADREKLKAYLQQAALLALPSVEDNCPMVVLEAMAAGVPVVAARVGGVPDLIEEGKTGWSCDPFDAASMRSGVEGALADPSVARETARRARQCALERYHPLVVARRHVEIYREVLQRLA